MQGRTKKDVTNTVVLLILLVGAGLVGYYATVALTTKDPLWFLKGVDDQPSRIIVYHDAQITELQAGDPGFDEIATAVQATLAEGFARLTNIGYSEQSLQQAYSEHTSLEVIWSRPVDLHTWFPAGRTTQMLFPITGRHAEMEIVLLGDNGQYRAGAPVLKDINPIWDVLESLDYN